MNGYTVACGVDGIYAGVMNPTRDDGTKTWKAKTECTENAIKAVCEWLIKTNNVGGYTFKSDDMKLYNIEVTVL